MTVFSRLFFHDIFSYFFQDICEIFFDRNDIFFLHSSYFTAYLGQQENTEVLASNNKIDASLVLDLIKQNRELQQQLKY